MEPRGRAFSTHPNYHGSFYIGYFIAAQNIMQHAQSRYK